MHKRCWIKRHESIGRLDPLHLVLRILYVCVCPTGNGERCSIGHRTKVIKSEMFGLALAPARLEWVNLARIPTTAVPASSIVGAGPGFGIKQRPAGDSLQEIGAARPAAFPAAGYRRGLAFGMTQARWPDFTREQFDCASRGTS